MWHCRLTLIGPARAVSSFVDNTGWSRTLGARHIEWLQLSPTRHVCQFETDQPPVTPLENISRRWLRLTLLVDYEDEKARIKGLAKANGGRVEHHWLRY